MTTAESGLILEGQALEDARLVAQWGVAEAADFYVECEIKHESCSARDEAAHLAAITAAAHTLGNIYSPRGLGALSAREVAALIVSGRREIDFALDAEDDALRFPEQYPEADLAWHQNRREVAERVLAILEAA